MIFIELVFAVIPVIILFLYGIEQFSREIQQAAGEHFRSFIQKVTCTPARGVLAGTLVTAVIQSSTATTVITVGLVNAGIISFSSSLGIIIGSNIGTTVTSQLVALKLTSFAPFLIVAGFAIGIAGGKYRVLGRPLFYFGLVFFSLSLISTILEPYRYDPSLVSILAALDNPFLQIGFGFLVTTLFQSSSVTTGLVVVMAQNGLLSPGTAIPILLGANLGTPTTALLVAWRMNMPAKRVASAHFLFNFLGVLLFLPFLGPFADLVRMLGGDPAQQVANAHLIFNLVCGIVFLAALQPFASLVKMTVPGQEEEIVFSPRYLGKPLPGDTGEAIALVSREVTHLMTTAGEALSCICGLIDAPKFDTGRITLLQDYVRFLDDEISAAILDVSTRELGKGDAEKLACLARISSLGRVLADESRDLVSVLSLAREREIDLPPEMVTVMRDFLVASAENLSRLSKVFPDVPDDVDAAMRSVDESLRVEITRFYHHYLINHATRRSPFWSIGSRMLFYIEGISATVREMRKTARLCRKT
ncbi:MAG: Na/Pi cotransporter family protein [Methanolinea sp.]